MTKIDVIVLGDNTELLTGTDTVTEIIENNVGRRGERGAQGLRGESGGITFDATAGETVSALRVVYEDEQGKCFALSNSDEQNIDRVIGVTKTAGSTGDTIEIQRHGEIDITGLGLAAGRVYLGMSGNLTNIAPNQGFDLLVGYAVSDKKLYINLNDSILLDEV